MKKLIVLIMSVITMFTVAACAQPSGEGYTFYAPDGAPALAIASLINEDKSFNYNIVAAADIGATIIQEKADFAILPVNAASKLAASGEKYKMLAVVTNGNLFIAGTAPAEKLSDLLGKVVGVIGQGNVPDLTLKAILNKNNLKYVESETAIEGKIALKYYAQASDMLPALKTGKLTFGLLPEPALTKALSMIEGLTDLFDLQSLYGAGYPQAVLLAKSSIIESNPSLAKKVIKSIENCSTYLKNNTETGITAINGYVVEGLTPSLDAASITALTIERCNIRVVYAADAKTYVGDYLAAIGAVAPAAVGTVVDGFYASVK